MAGTTGKVTSMRGSNDAAPAHPADLHRLALLHDHRDGARAPGQLQQARAGRVILLHVVFHERDATPFQIVPGGSAVGTTGGRVELDRLAHSFSSLIARER